MSRLNFSAPASATRSVSIGHNLDRSVPREMALRSSGADGPKDPPITTRGGRFTVVSAAALGRRGDDADGPKDPPDPVRG